MSSPVAGNPFGLQLLVVVHTPPVVGSQVYVVAFADMSDKNKMPSISKQIRVI